MFIVTKVTTLNIKIFFEYEKKRDKLLLNLFIFVIRFCYFYIL
jgi:hypothetical protein